LGIESVGLGVAVILVVKLVMGNYLNYWIIGIGAQSTLGA